MVLAARVRVFCTASDSTYGYRRIHADLVAQDIACSARSVRQIMPALDLVLRQPRPFRVTTGADARAAVDMPVWWNRTSPRTYPGPSSSGGVTYIHTWHSFI